MPKSARAWHPYPAWHPEIRFTHIHMSNTHRPALGKPTADSHASPPGAREKTRASIYRVVFGPFVKKTRLLKNCVAVSPWLARTGIFAGEENSPDLFLIGPSDFGKSQIRAVWGILAVWG
jgi:hypothetical protein